MQVRPARYQDVSTIGSIFASAFHDESLNVALFPHRIQYPDDYVRAWRHKASEDWWDYKKSFFVSYEIEDGREWVVGVAEWSREGDGWEKLWGIKGWWDPRRLIFPLVRTYHTFHRLLFPNRASVRSTPTNPTPITYWNWMPQIVPFLTPLLTPPTQSPSIPNAPYLELSILTVLPTHQSQGHGRTLVTQGLSVARSETIPAVVIAAENKERFYQRCGFGVLVGWATEGKGNPLARLGIRGGAVLWTEGCEGGKGDE